MNKYAILTIIILVTGCQNNKSKHIVNNKLHTDTVHILKPPQIPLMIISEQEKKEYLATHFWENLEVSDSTLMYNENVLQKCMIEFIYILKNISYSESKLRKAIASLCNITSIKKTQYKKLVEYFERYLYNANSPLYDEYLYSIYLEEKIKITDKDNPLLSSYKFRLKLINRNKVGSKACNFKFSLPNNNISSLYKTEIKTKYLLLIFYDPECHSCHEIMSRMFNDNILNTAIEQNIVTVMAVYTNGNNKVWKNSLTEMPSKWIICNDNLYITNNALYDLKAMPTIYLLSREKKVLMKDASFSKILKIIKEEV